ncbi:hypothetical protein O181_070328 [Austropuccinia psidii MF-1]|uniref:Uncharacterized protein n=1 Tax=Austropuccinia psidii MF-1 TaxID=1389203 RepID=A0A9Q3EYW8_9BASI|nr:hypothetical protein [Austropuccinia psidii MF-1]
MRQIYDSAIDPDAEGSDELDGEEAEVVLSSAGNQSSISPSQPAAKRFQSQIVPISPMNLQPALSTIPSSIPSFLSAIRQSPILQPRSFPLVTSQKFQPVASSSRRREDQFPLLFPAAQVFQKRECWPIQVTRED